MLDYPRLSTPVVMLVIAVAFSVGALAGERLPNWMRLLFTLTALIFGVIGMFALTDWLLHQWIERQRELNNARVYGAVQLARALKELSPQQVEIVGRHDLHQVTGLLGENGPIWTIRTPMGVDVPLEFVQDYFEWSARTRPYLWPVHKAHEVGIRTGADRPYPNAERMAAAVVDLLVSARIAERAEGRHAARLMLPIETAAAKFGIEVEE